LVYKTFFLTAASAKIVTHLQVMQHKYRLYKITNGSKKSILQRFVNSCHIFGEQEKLI